MLRAIAELRDEVNRLIDDQVSRINSMELRPAELAAHPVAPEPVIDRLPPVASPVVKEKVPVKKAPRAILTPEPVTPAPAPAPPAAPAPAPAAAAAASTEDPRKRLDALAKHLDGRLKRGNGTTPERAKAEVE